MRAVVQRGGFVEEGAGEGDDLVTADLVVALALLGAVLFADHVGAVERVVQRAPAGVGGVQGEAGVHHRHHQLRAGHAGDLFVDVGGGGLEVGRLGEQVADFLEEGLVGHGIVAWPARAWCQASICAWSSSRLASRALFLGARSLMTASAPAQNFGADAGSGDGFVVHEVEQDSGDLQATDLNALSHCLPHSAQYPLRTVLQCL